MNDYVWLCMTLYDCVCLWMSMFDYVWLCMITNGSMPMYDYVCMAMYGYVWQYMTMYYKSDCVWLCITKYDS